MLPPGCVFSTRMLCEGSPGLTSWRIEPSESSGCCPPEKWQPVHFERTIGRTSCAKLTLGAGGGGGGGGGGEGGVLVVPCLQAFLPASIAFHVSLSSWPIDQQQTPRTPSLCASLIFASIALASWN